MSQLQEIRSRLSTTGLDRVAGSILKMIRPCYHIERTLVPEESLTLGASKFGGSPEVPEDFIWPEVSGSKQTEPMEFVAQIRLADLPEPPPEAIPREGLLSIFTRWS